MGDAKRVPHHGVGAGERCVLGRPQLEAEAVLGLHDVVARGVALGGGSGARGAGTRRLGRQTVVCMRVRLLGGASMLEQGAPDAPRSLGCRGLGRSAPAATARVSGRTWSSRCGVTKRCLVAKNARLATRLPGCMSIGTLCVGTSLNATGWPVMGLMTEGFLIFQARPWDGSALRIAACTLSSGVSQTCGASRGGGRGSHRVGAGAGQGRIAGKCMLRAAAQPPARAFAIGAARAQAHPEGVAVGVARPHGHHLGVDLGHHQVLATCASGWGKTTNVAGAGRQRGAAATQ